MAHENKFNFLEETTPVSLMKLGILSIKSEIDTYNTTCENGKYVEKSISQIEIVFSNGRVLYILCMICARISLCVHEQSLIIMCCNNCGTRLYIPDLINYVNQIPLDQKALCKVDFDTIYLDNNGDLIEEVEEDFEEDSEASEERAAAAAAEAAAAAKVFNPLPVISYLIKTNRYERQLTACEENIFYSKDYYSFCRSEYCNMLELDDSHRHEYGYQTQGGCKLLM